MLKRVISWLFIGLALLIIFGYIFWYKKDRIIASIINYSEYNTNNKIDYYGILEIPKLDINNIVYNKDNKNNNVNKNIFLVNDNSNLIVLASHSGSSPISYFNKLYKLKNNDQIIFKMNNRERKYEIFKKENVLKTGKVKIKQYNYPIIVLITCSKTNDNYQEVYYARLILSEKIS